MGGKRDKQVKQVAWAKAAKASATWAATAAATAPWRRGSSASQGGTGVSTADQVEEEERVERTTTTVPVPMATGPPGVRVVLVSRGRKWAGSYGRSYMDSTGRV